MLKDVKRCKRNVRHEKEPNEIWRGGKENIQKKNKLNEINIRLDTVEDQ